MTASVVVMVVLSVEVDCRYLEQKALAIADRLGLRKALRTLSALQPELRQRPIKSSLVQAESNHLLIPYDPREDRVWQEERPEEYR